MESSANESPGSVVMLSGDLMFASRVKAAAERAGLEYQMGGQLPDEETEGIRFVILDLSTRSKLTPEIAAQCQQRCPQARLIAYGPHVHVEKIRLAKESGIPIVMTNGQFDSQLSTLFSN
ncbi:MAG: histidine kinase [Rubripirellula sp.]